MNNFIDAFVTELRTLVADLGKGGGCISPSVYDTAQLLRLFPPPEGTEPAFAWLLAQQQSDGGWGSPSTPYARDVPTLAALLALHAYGKDQTMQAVIDAGLTFLRMQADQWVEVPIDALPIAAEMILPYLVDEAIAVGFALSRAPYALLYRLKAQKYKHVSRSALQPGAAPTYSWEAWGKEAVSLLPDHSGGIGHSPAATAAWLREAESYADLVEPCAVARRYLAKAAAATGLDIPGVVPNVWPITGFELTYALYALLITDLLHQPALQEASRTVLDDLWIIMQRGHGVSFGEYFTSDVDGTAVALAVLQAAAYPIEPAVILQFKNGNHFCTYHRELNPSSFSNAHALYALAAAGQRFPATETFLLERQAADGRWLADKWHSSWIYTTFEVILALSKLGYTKQVWQAANALLHAQHRDGGWGSGHHSSRLETCYAVLALTTLRQQGLFSEETHHRLQRGQEWLQYQYCRQPVAHEQLWLGKELYAPYRVDRAYELSALASIALEKVLL